MGTCMNREDIIRNWFTQNNMLDAKEELTNNTINFGLEASVKNAIQNMIMKYNNQLN